MKRRTPGWEQGGRRRTEQTLTEGVKPCAASTLPLLNPDTALSTPCPCQNLDRTCRADKEGGAWEQGGDGPQEEDRDAPRAELTTVTPLESGWQKHRPSE